MVVGAVLEIAVVEVVVEDAEDEVAAHEAVGAQGGAP